MIKENGDVSEVSVEYWDHSFWVNKTVGHLKIPEYLMIMMVNFFKQQQQQQKGLYG